MSENQATSLLSYCISCEAKCCHNQLLIISKPEYEAIVSAGHPDYWTEMTIPEGDYYFQDFRNVEGKPGSNPCRYLDGHLCTIEEVKSDMCKTYPVKVDSTDKDCPAVIGLGLTKTYIDSVAPLVKRMGESITRKGYWRIVDTVDERITRSQNVNACTVLQPK